MNDLWSLPKQAVIGGKSYDLYTDFRDILELMGYLEDEALPVYFRWQIALGLFYRQPVPPEDQAEAMEYLARFLAPGPAPKPGPKRMDWQQDAQAILADVNRVAGKEVRQEAYVHWWTFLSWFHAIGEGQLSYLVALRDKLRRGEKLTAQEAEFYRRNPQRVRLRDSPADAQKARLEKLLSGRGGAM